MIFNSKRKLNIGALSLLFSFAISVPTITHTEEIATVPHAKFQKTIKASNAPIEVFVREKNIPSDKILDASIKRLEAAVDATPTTHNNRAQILFNLTEIYRIKSKSFEKKTFQKHDSCKTNKITYNSCKIAAEKFYAKDAEKIRRKSIAINAKIIRFHPTFPKLDEVYFFLGSSFLKMKEKKGVYVLKLILADFPTSKFIPNLLFELGNYHLERGDVKNALSAYKKVRKYKNASIYAYARYKEAWCYSKLENHEKALSTNAEYLRIAQKAANKKILNRGSKNLVLAYSHLGQPQKAMPFFKKLARPNKLNWQKMAEELASLYTAKGDYSGSIIVLKELMISKKESVKIVDYQLSIARNTNKMGSFTLASVRELVRLAKLVKHVDNGNFKDLNKEIWTAKKREIETLFRHWIATYDREGMDEMVGVLNRSYLKAYPDSK